MNVKETLEAWSYLDDFSALCTVVQDLITNTVNDVLEETIQDLRKQGRIIDKP